MFGAKQCKQYKIIVEVHDFSILVREASRLIKVDSTMGTGSDKIPVSLFKQELSPILVT